MTMTASRTSSMMLTSASGLRRVGEAPVLHTRMLVQDRRLHRRGRHDVDNLRASDDQCISNQPTMAAPRHRLTAHDHRPAVFSQLEQLIEAVLEVIAIHVVGVVAEGFDL